MKRVVKYIYSLLATIITKLLIISLAFFVCVLYFSPTIAYAESIQEEDENEFGPYFEEDITDNGSLIDNTPLLENVNAISNYYSFADDANQEEDNVYYFGNNSNVYYENDEEKEIDTTIRRLFAGVGSSYSYANSTNTIKSLYPSNTLTPIKLTKDDTFLYVKLLDYESSGSPKLKDSELIYLLNNNVNLDVIVKNNNICQNIVINGPIDNYSFSFEVNIENGYYSYTEGFLNIYDNDSNYLFTYYAPCAYDSDENESIVNVSMKNNIITYSLDSSWANSEDRVFPITIDPEATVWGHSGFDISISSAYPTYTLGYENLKAQDYVLRHEYNGYMYIGAHPTYGDTYTFYRLKDITDTGHPLNLSQNKYVKSASVHFSVADKNITTGTDSLIACRLTAPFSETSANYNNSNYLISSSTDCVSYPIDNSTTGVDINLTDYVKDVIQEHKPNYGLVFFLQNQTKNYIRFVANEYQNYPGYNSWTVPGGKVYYYDNNDIQGFSDISINLRPFVKYSFDDGLCHFVSLGIDGKASYKNNLHLSILNSDNTIFILKTYMLKMISLFTQAIVLPILKY